MGCVCGCLCVCVGISNTFKFNQIQTFFFNINNRVEHVEAQNHSILGDK